MKKKTAKITR